MILCTALRRANAASHQVHFLRAIVFANTAHRTISPLATGAGETPTKDWACQLGAELQVTTCDSCTQWHHAWCHIV